MIHPFQDGNGRVARLLASLILIKSNYFPFTVLREEARVKYIDALEEADNGNCQKLIDYFAEVQRRNIERALNLKEVTGTSFEEVANIFTNKLDTWQKRQQQEYERTLANSRLRVFNYCNQVLEEYVQSLRRRFNGGARIDLVSCGFDDSRQTYYYKQIVKYANKHDYYFNRSLPKAWLNVDFELSEIKRYKLIFTIHHYGYDDSTISIGAFLEYKGLTTNDVDDYTLPLEIEPHVISLRNNSNVKEKNIRAYIENVFTFALAQIASEI